ncbi:MAG: hypothetical protein RRZ64_05455 [Rikenellaceae bacterium]
MSEKIYYGDLDIIDTRTNIAKRFYNVVYKISNTISELRCVKAKEVPLKDLKYYRVVYYPDTAKVLGMSNI